jgi:hypothetical protein
VVIDYKSNADIDEDDFVVWQEELQLFGSAIYYENKWMLDVADLVKDLQATKQNLCCINFP